MPNRGRVQAGHSALIRADETPFQRTLGLRLTSA